MTNLLFIPLAVLYFLITGILFFYGLNFMYMVFLVITGRLRRKKKPAPLTHWPRVTVQLPIFNEMYVAERLVEATANLDYPRKLLEIQVLDDSTDETLAIVRRAVSRARARGINIHHIHRTNRSGYKAGALKEGFEKARGEFFAIFDADFVPKKDFLRRTVPEFQDPEIAFVQTRWAHLNRDFSLLTLIQSFSIDAHFMVEQYAKSRSGLWFNFNGTAGVWRRRAIEDAGGWRTTTLTEDMDLSYRAFLKGWKATFLSDVRAPAELPVAFSAFRRQQHRWARGSLECAIMLLPKIWRGDFPLRKKIQSTFHLGGYGVHLLLFIYVLLYPVVILMSQQYPGLISLFGVSYLFALTSLAPLMVFITAQIQLKRKLGLWVPFLFLISAFGAGMMMNTVRAALEIIYHKPNEFKRTPKFGVVSKTRDWEKQKYQIKLDSIVFWELLLVGVNLTTLAMAIHYGHWLMGLYAAMFAFGLAFTSSYTIVQTLQIQRAQLHANVAIVETR